MTNGVRLCERSETSAHGTQSLSVSREYISYLNVHFNRHFCICIRV